MDKAYGLHEVLAITQIIWIYATYELNSTLNSTHLWPKALMTPFSGALTLEEEIFNRHNKWNFNCKGFYIGNIQEELQSSSSCWTPDRYTGMSYHFVHIALISGLTIHPIPHPLPGLVKKTWPSLGELNRMSVSRSPVDIFWWFQILGMRSLTINAKV